ncbi:MAG TPA: endonuclease/exonuclease/phosphatase family protein [Xanthobacteraceae bacterium]|nr:endonuclease/exonuclease/phosphatase family protein [Xanthobacteraceae bacterium]
MAEKMSAGLLQPLIYTLAGVVVLVTLLPFWRTDRWWVRICDFPRFQIAVVAGILVAALAYLRWPGTAVDWIVTALLAGVLVWQGSWVWGYLPGAPKAVAQSRRPANDPACITLFIANVMQTNRNSDELLAIIADADPDVILLAETDEWWSAQLSRRLEVSYRHRLCHPLPTGYGLALFSRLDLIEPTVRHVIDKDVPSIRTGVQLRSGDIVDLYGVHPPPPAPAQGSAERDTELLVTGREVKARGRPAIVLGDLNDVAWSRTTLQFQQAGGLRDPRRGRGFYSTFHAKLPGLRYPLDYVFHTPHFRVGKLRVLPHFGSDHLPLVAVLCYEPMDVNGV